MEKAIEITEDYVSFETAKLLKEKGFDIPCRSNYRSAYPNNISPFYHNGPKDFNGREYTNLNSEWYSAPTLQMAMKWLREVHNIIIELHHQYRKEWYAIVSSENPLGIGVHTTSTFNTYEEACEAAIKYCLENLI